MNESDVPAQANAIVLQALAQQAVEAIRSRAQAEDRDQISPDEILDEIRSARAARSR